MTLPSVVGDVIMLKWLFKDSLQTRDYLLTGTFLNLAGIISTTIWQLLDSEHEYKNIVPILLRGII